MKNKIKSKRSAKIWPLRAGSLLCLLLFGWLLLAIGSLSAQGLSVSVQQFGLAEGLIERNTHLFKENNGFHWRFSVRGLQPYDGCNFKIYDLLPGGSFAVEEIGYGAEDESVQVSGNGVSWFNKHSISYVINPIGQPVQQTKLANSTRQLTINTNELGIKPGTYLITARSQDRMITSRLVVLTN